MHKTMGSIAYNTWVDVQRLNRDEFTRIGHLKYQITIYSYAFYARHSTAARTNYPDKIVYIF